jgi:hypothetical protein
MENQCRKFIGENTIDKCISYKTTPLIKVNENGIVYYNTKKEKLEALRTRTPDDKFLLVWPGQWSTDVFELSKDDILQGIISLL